MIMRATEACTDFDSQRTARAAAQLLDDSTASGEFLARMSQELRTPINALLSFARALETSETGKQRPEDLRVLSRVRASGEKLLRLVEDAVGQARAEGRLTKTATATNVVELTSRLMDHYRPQAVAKGLRLFSLLPESTSPVRLDPRLFQQVVAHLLDNAVKFTVSGSIKVTLVTDLESRQPTGLIVADTGVGIPADVQGRIFLPRAPLADAAKQSDDGAGLGLPLTLELCEAMGCCLTVASEVGQGSRFTIRFPNG